MCHVEKGVRFGRRCSVDKDCSVGAYTYINSYSLITRATIGRYCSIGNFVSIGPGEHDLAKLSTSGYFYDDKYQELTKKDCVIGNDVWIGNYAIVKRGVTVGDGAVIGAHAVVTKDVPPFAVMAGVPAKIIKMRFSIETAARLNESRWWMLCPSDARQIMRNIEAHYKR